VQERWWELWFVKVVPKYLNSSTFQRNYYQSLYCDLGIDGTSIEMDLKQIEWGDVDQIHVTRGGDIGGLFWTWSWTFEFKKWRNIFLTKCETEIFANKTLFYVDICPQHGRFRVSFIAYETCNRLEFKQSEFLLQFSLPYFIRQSRSADLKLLRKPHIFKMCLIRSLLR